MRYFLVLAIFCLCNFTGFGASLCPRNNFFSIGPETYHLDRERDGGTQQDGWITGFRVGYDRIKRYAIYIGADYLYATGGLDGHTVTGRSLTSHLTDSIVEVRAGYTLQQKGPRSYFITPFAGYGYFREVNKFFPPSPIPLTFTDSFHFYAAGFLSGVNITPLLSMGINFKLRFMQDGTSEVTDDPMYDRVSLDMQDELHARVEVPFFFNMRGSNLPGPGFLAAPFFEFRHFGGREGFPFNFRDTKFYLYGARFAVTYQF